MSNAAVPFYKQLSEDTAGAGAVSFDVQGSFRGMWIDRCDVAVLFRIGSVEFTIPAGARGPVWWGIPQSEASVAVLERTNAAINRSVNGEGALYFTGYLTNEAKPDSSEAIAAAPWNFLRFPDNIETVQRITPIVKVDAPYGEEADATYYTGLATDGQRVRFNAYSAEFRTLTPVPYTVPVSLTVASPSRTLGYVCLRTGAGAKAQQQLRLRRAWVRILSASVMTDIAIVLCRCDRIPNAGGTAAQTFLHGHTGGGGSGVPYGDGLPRSFDLESRYFPQIALTTTLDRLVTIPVNLANCNGTIQFDLWRDDIPDGEGAITNTDGVANSYGGGFCIILESNAVLTVVQAIGHITVS